ncbi:MAG: hypothetical protein HY962_12745 [Ignavibacteriae bacterium]|nr:hypothetical protein [Ignavibacteriota bacterium]
MRNCVFTIVLTLLLGPALLAQGVPQSMAYQGYVTDLAGSPVADGNYSFTFALYTVESGGTALWQETHPTVAVTKGLFAVHLGRGNPAVPLTPLFDQQYFLGIKMGVDPEMTPRVRLSTSAYSFHARTADGVAPGSITDASVAAGANIAASKLQSSILTEAEVLAGSGVTIDRAGGNLTINASPGAVVLAGDVTGPAGSNVIANNAVTTAKIANDAVTNAKIATNAVGTTQIANDAVTAAKIAPNVVSSIAGVSNDGGDINLVAGANVTITPNDAANTITIAAAGGGGGGLTLPYSGTVSSATNAFAVENTGTGRAAQFEINNASSTQDAVYIVTNSTSTSSNALDIDGGGGNAIEARNNSGTVATIDVYNLGGGSVAKFGNGSTSAGNIVEITKSGGTGKGMNITYGGSSNAIYVDNNSTGTGIELRQDGTGKAAYFHIENTTSTENAVYAESKSTSASSDAFQAKANAGRAFYGESAITSGSNTVYSRNTSTGGAYFGVNTSTSYPTANFQNTSTTANAPILKTYGGGGDVTIDREGDISADGKITADEEVSGTRFIATSNASTAAGSVGVNNVVYAWARVDLSGTTLTTLASFGCTVARSGVGNYRLTFTTAFGNSNNICAVASCRQSAGNYTATIALYGTTYIDIETYNGSGTQVDCDFQVIVTGVR